MLRISDASWRQAEANLPALRAQIQITNAELEESVRDLQAQGLIVAIVDADSTVRWQMTYAGRRALEDAR
jgi:DNA-binding HxlR family transcriptional regulator